MQENLSRREQNFRETWNAIREAAFRLAVTEAQPATTVEEIAEAAGVSRRTFFNYFSSKEDAILGVRLPKVTDQTVEEFDASEDDELTSVARLLLNVMRTSIPTSGMQRRREAIEALPVLRTRLSNLLGDVEQAVRKVLVSGNERPGGRVYRDDQELDVLLMLASSIVRHSVMVHYAEKTDIHLLLDRSITAFRKVMDRTR